MWVDTYFLRCVQRVLMMIIWLLYFMHHNFICWFFFAFSLWQNVLNIPEVHTEDAGLFVCTASNAERSLDQATLLVVTGVIPRCGGVLLLFLLIRNIFSKCWDLIMKGFLRFFISIFFKYYYLLYRTMYDYYPFGGIFILVT